MNQSAASAVSETSPSFGLRVEEVTRSFGSTKALDRVSLDVPSKSIFGLVGPNGAGKTTLFSIIAGFLKPDGGKFDILEGLLPESPDLLGRVSILPQDALFDRNLSILDQLVFYRRLQGGSRRAARDEVADALTRVGLGSYLERGVSVLSHGMAKRLGIAQAFLGSPELIFLDEPTAGLDPRNAKRIREVIDDLSQHSTVVVSSHNLFELEDLCDHVGILDRGQVKAVGTLEAIMSDRRRIELEFATALTEEDLDAYRSISTVAAAELIAGRRYHLNLSDSADPAEAIAEVLELTLKRSLTPKSFREGSSLEEIFLELTEESPS